MNQEQPMLPPSAESRQLDPQTLLPRTVRRWLVTVVGSLLALSLYLIAVRGTAIIFDLRDAISAFCF